MQAHDVPGLEGPDLKQGIDANAFEEGGIVLGYFGREPVVVAKSGGEFFAVGATCPHYGGPLAQGLVVDGTIRCPRHHACFSLRTGEVLSAPALDPIVPWALEHRAGRLFVIGKAKPCVPSPSAAPSDVRAIVIVGGGAAGQVAAETLRREGFSGALTMLSADSSPPCDRPNLSKDFLAGSAPEAWIPLRPREFFEDNRITLELGRKVTGLDIANRRVVTEGTAYSYDRLLLATGADPVALGVPGAELPHVHYLRTLADSRSIIRGAGRARQVVVIGGSFIGLEVAASLRARGLAVHVVAPELRPLERVFGAEVGDFVRTLHEAHGVVFHLGHKVQSIEPGRVFLDDGESLAADLVVAGVGVKPAVGLAELAGLATDRGVVVDRYLETSAPGVYAAGDIARWPDPNTGATIRVEHWAVAERHGRLAAQNILGKQVPCDVVPFFWSEHYDATLRYVGHAEKWDRLEIDGDLGNRDARVTYFLDDQALAVATVGRALESLRAEAEMEALRDRFVANSGGA